MWSAAPAVRSSPARFQPPRLIGPPPDRQHRVSPPPCVGILDRGVGAVGGETRPYVDAKVPASADKAPFAVTGAPAPNWMVWCEAIPPASSARRAASGRRGTPPRSAASRRHAARPARNRRDGRCGPQGRLPSSTRLTTRSSSRNSPDTRIALQIGRHQRADMQPAESQRVPRPRAAPLAGCVSPSAAPVGLLDIGEDTPGPFQGSARRRRSRSRTRGPLRQPAHRDALQRRDQPVTPAATAQACAPAATTPAGRPTANKGLHGVDPVHAIIHMTQ